MKKDAPGVWGRDEKQTWRKRVVPAGGLYDTFFRSAIFEAAHAENMASNK
jgi:hypothetical protein